MLDKLQRIAAAVSFLRVPSIIVGAACLISILVLLAASESREQDRWLMPGFVGLLWSLCAFTFIETFRHVPPKADARSGVYGRLARGLRRAGYWMTSVMLLVATVLAIILTSRLIAIWLSEYGT